MKRSLSKIFARIFHPYLIENPLIDVKNFMEQADQKVRDYPTGVIEKKEAFLRIYLHMEEMSELNDAIRKRKVLKIADGLADVCYVVFGTALAFGIPLWRVLKLVHENNMTKLKSKINRREDGKIEKPENFEPVDLVEVIYVNSTEKGKDW